jgi:hypothetical protein
VDQSQTSITVLAIADATERKIHARDIKSLGRSVLLESPDQPANHQDSTADISLENDPESVSPNANYGETEADQESSNATEQPEEPVTPTYNAWQVWTYLERQRLKTLKLINTFDAEWEANRFVREAERNTPPNLRIHYEICPIWRDLDSAASDINHDNQEPDLDDNPSDRDAVEYADKYADVIDVEIIDQVAS